MRKAEGNVDHHISPVVSFSPTLTEKRMYNNLPHILTKVAETEMARLPAELAEYSVTYIPQV